MKLELFRPVSPWSINQKFGENANSFYATLGLKGHNGLDLFAYHGQPVRAAHNGIVTFAGEDGSAGYGVVIRTEDKREYNGGEAHIKSIYWHLIPNIPVRAGQRVNVGDIIGYADNTGMSTGDHLHFGCKPVMQGEQDWQWNNIEKGNGYFGAIDPLPYMSHLSAEEYQSISNKLKEWSLLLGSWITALLKK